MASPAPTPQALYERLRALSQVTSDEDLARDLGIKLRTLTRLKAGEGTQYDTTIRLLAAAGWLSLDGDADPRARLRQAERFVERNLRELQALREAVEAVPETRESGGRSG